MLEYFSVGSIILDDIVLPDGNTRMGVLGGGAIHAAMGMSVWSSSVGLISPVGKDFPKYGFRKLGRIFDLQGLQQHAVTTPRAWQVYEEDGHRTEVFRTDFNQFLDIAPNPALLLGRDFRARGVHLQCATPEPLVSWISRLRELKCECILWEPWDMYCQAENRDEIFRLLPLVDVFSPNLIEAQRISGLIDVEQIAQTLLEEGAMCVSIRMGEAGSLVADRDGARLRIPVVPVEDIIDVTGAGNAYCGGFLVGYAETGDLLQAAHRGTVSASFALEQFGAVYPIRGLAEKAAERLLNLESVSK